MAQAAVRRRGRSGSRRSGPTLHDVAVDLRAAFVEHNLLTYAAAVAFQAILALIPLTMLFLALLGASGLGHLWADTLAPALRAHLTPALFDAVDTTARRIVSSGTGTTILFAGLLAGWYLTAAVRPVMEALNRIHDVDDDRSWRRRALVALGLGLTLGAAISGSALLLAWGSTVSGSLSIAVDAGRWIVAIALLGLTVALFVRFAPADHPQPRWASAGSVLVVAVWLVAGVAFKWWVTSVVDFHSPVGSLAGLLALGGFLFVSTAIFLVGVQLDETLRRLTGGRARVILPWFSR
ncbi:MAG TPA: YihY/virulence factor BrkB family protein [Gaiellaceae bacterium]|nr:YihY/virulence factor BrkB family protein [Gaiellaceae bacterium]